MTSSLHNQLDELIRACFTGIWVKTLEANEAVAEIRQLSSSQAWQCLSWDILGGLTVAGGESVTGTNDPLFAIKSIAAHATANGTSVLTLLNFHRFMGSAEIVQALTQAVIAGKATRQIIVIVAPVVQLPPELQRLFVVVEHDVPTRQELQTLLEAIATDEGDIATDEAKSQALDASVGLTRSEAENAFSLSLVRHGNIQPDAILDLKIQTLNKSGLIQISRHEGNFGSLGGLSSLKAFTKRALLRSATSSVRARGVLLLSPPGCGKSEFCKLLGNEVGRPVITLDVGSLLGSLVGQSEERTREALKVIDALAPCILMIDEIEKAFSGANGQGDSGVSSRLFGTMLTWLNDHTSDVFVVCTSNDISRLPPEFSRAERFDAVFFVDLPGRAQKDAIWSLYRGQYGIDESELHPIDDNWTGAEIRSCCRLAALLDIPLVQSAQNVVPVAVTSQEAIDRLRSWASGRCLDAESTGVYRFAGTTSKPSTGRSVARRGSSLN